MKLNIIKKEESKIKAKFNLVDDDDELNLDLRTLKTNVIIQKLESDIKLREMSAQKRFSKLLK